MTNSTSIPSQFPREQTPSGSFERQEDSFRHWISRDGSTSYAPQAGSYHLYVSLACPWAHRTMIVRHLKGLEKTVSLSVVDPIRDDRGWAFRDGPGHSRDPINGFLFLHEAYLASDSGFQGRATVPVLWDKERQRIVNNSEDDICRMFNDAFVSGSEASPNLFPKDIEAEHARLAAFIYEKVNNGVYRAGFATTQACYEKSCRDVFAGLDELEARLSSSRYLFGNQPVEADWRLFCTLVRFDSVYHGHFKCNVRRIIDYPHLSGYLMDLYQQPGIAGTVNFDHIKRHYYGTHGNLNPSHIVPIGPALNLNLPHGRQDR